MSSFLVQLLVLWTLLGCFAPTTTSKTNHPIAKPNCDDHCGNVSIPFPFGLTQDCSFNSEFLINCTTISTDQPPTPFLPNGNLEVRWISTEKGQLSVMNYIARNCYAGDLSSVWIHLSTFYVSQNANKFVAVGCNTVATVSGYGDQRSYQTGCIASCNRFGDVVNGACSGIGCCQMTDIPILARNINFTLNRMTENLYTDGVSNCSYALVVKKDDFNFSGDMLTKKWEVGKLPIVIDWLISNDTCSNSSNICKGNSNCDPFEGPDGGYRCSCKKGYEGNPYLHPGCLEFLFIDDSADIDECANGQNNCSRNATCQNKPGGFSCYCKEGFQEDGKGGCQLPSKDKNKVNAIVLGVSLGTITLLISGFCVYLGYRRRKSVQMKEKFFKENGGLILQQRIAQGTASSRTTRIFTAEELKKATNNYDQTLIVGEGEEERNLSLHFLSSLKENRLFGIFDDNVVCEGTTEELMEVSLLAERCLNVKGEDRPTMKEVAVVLGGLMKAAKHPWINNSITSMESQSLLTESSIPLGYDATFSITTAYDSLKHHMELSVAAGR
nr:putative wall-associated receptor kinase-like 16 [Ipomoea batatas]